MIKRKCRFLILNFQFSLVVYINILFIQLESIQEMLLTVSSIPSSLKELKRICKSHISNTMIHYYFIDNFLLLFVPQINWWNSRKSYKIDCNWTGQSTCASWRSWHFLYSSNKNSKWSTQSSYRFNACCHL